jgi:hypothetical protein
MEEGKNPGSQAIPAITTYLLIWNVLLAGVIVVI